MPPRLVVFCLIFCTVCSLNAQTGEDAPAFDFPVDSELYALMTDHLGTDTGPESICGIGSVSGRPFIASRVYSSLGKDADGVEAPHSYLIARDRFGRVRCEIGYLEPTFERTHKRVRLGTYVYDPVGQTHVSIYPEGFHRAFVIPFALMDPVFEDHSPILSFCMLAAAEDARCLRKFRESWKDKVISSEDLGIKVVSGRDANGYIDVVEFADQGDRKTSTGTLEEWVSMDDRLLLRESRQNGLSYTRTLAVTDLRFEEPPASLFEVPGDDVVHQVSSLP